MYWKNRNCFHSHVKCLLQSPSLLRSWHSPNLQVYWAIYFSCFVNSFFQHGYRRWSYWCFKQDHLNEDNVIATLLFISVNIDIPLYHNINEVNISAHLTDSPQLWLKAGTIFIRKLYKKETILNPVSMNHNKSCNVKCFLSNVYLHCNSVLSTVWIFKQYSLP